MIVPERDPHFIYTPGCLVSCSTKIIYFFANKTRPSVWLSASDSRETGEGIRSARARASLRQVPREE